MTTKTTLAMTWLSTTLLTAPVQAHEPQKHKDAFDPSIAAEPLADQDYGNDMLTIPDDADPSYVPSLDPLLSSPDEALPEIEPQVLPMVRYFMILKMVVGRAAKGREEL